MLPKRFWKADDRRTTPAGVPLEGENKDSYWCAEACPSGLPGPLADHLNKVLDDLMPHRDFLRLIRDEGGRCEFFVGVFLSSDAGEVFPYLLLAKMAELGIDLSLCMYRGDELPK
jgi:hypothetical protein